MRGQLLVLTLAFVLVAAPLALPQAAAQIESTGSLSGTVCAAPVGYSYPFPYYDDGGQDCWTDRLPGATVAIHKDGPVPSQPTIGAIDRSAETTEAGDFTFGNIPDGTYDLTVTRDGFLEFTAEVVVAEDERVGVTLKGDDVTATGTIMSEDGGPLEDATVEFCCSENRSFTTTGADGTFTVDVKAGFYNVNVQAPGHQGLYVYQLVDGTPIDLEMVPVPPADAEIRGTIKDQNGDPVAEARVSAYSYGSCCTDMAYYGGENFTFTDAQGRYTLGVYSGEGSINVQKDGYAGQYASFSITAGDDQVHDFKMMKYPEKTAHIEGQITDATGDGLSYVSVSIRHPEYGLYECSVDSGQGSQGSGGMEAKSSIASPDYYGYYDPGCAITVDSDGHFEGDVTPGYAIVTIYQDHWRTCDETYDSDGDYSRDCGPEYFTHTQTMMLEADDTTTFDVTLRQRPSANAEISGYLVDAETNHAIPDGQISFSNQESYGWGYASVDEDGSYAIRLRDGYHSVHVWAPGFLPWEGVIDIEEGETAFDVLLTPGNESYGGYCCYYASHGRGEVAMAEDSVSSSPGGASPRVAPPPGAPADAFTSDAASKAGGDGAQYEDLGGGLGEYDAAERQRLLNDQQELEDSKGSPGPGTALLIVGLVGAVALLRRRK